MWKVSVTGKAVKQLNKLTRPIQERFDVLAKELEVAGPYRFNWPHFGRLYVRQNLERYHCHIKSGRPTYVACWDVVDKEIKLVEVIYVGTHEKAPY